MDILVIALVVGIVVFYIVSKTRGSKELLGSGITYTHQLEFKLSKAVLSNTVILSQVGITKSEYKDDFQKWPKSRKKKWNDFLESKDTSFEYSEVGFCLTYLSHEDVFIIEFFADSKRNTYVVVNRSPNNTYLFDKTLVYHPHKDKDLRNEHIRLEVKLREDNGYYLITAGLRDFENEVTAGSDYTKLFDFPFGKSGLGRLNDEEYRKFGFEIERPSPWYDKDDFGKHVAHPWDTQVKYKHGSGVEITYQY